MLPLIHFQELLNHWAPTVIKGNAAEIGALSGLTEVATKGVDSVGPGFKNPVTVVKSLANRERGSSLKYDHTHNIVLL